MISVKEGKKWGEEGREGGREEKEGTLGELLLLLNSVILPDFNNSNINTVTAIQNLKTFSKNSMREVLSSYYT